MPRVPVPPLGPGDFHELRIHGVAGSSAESMLGLGARLSVVDVPRPTNLHDRVETEPDDITVWRPPAVDPQLRAWSWGSLTSGRWYQAFYLLLLPFMIANLAGWMLVARRDPTPDAPGAPEPHGAEFRDGLLRASALLVRLVGLLVTAVFVISAQLVLADVLAWQWLHRELDVGPWVVGVGTALTAAVFALLVALTRIRQRPQVPHQPWADHRDPVGLGFLQRRQGLLWNSPGINVALRRLHLTVGLGAVALLAAWPAAEVGNGWAVVGAIAFWLAITAVAAAAVLLARISLGDGESGLGRVLAAARHGTWPVATVAVALACLVPVGLPPDPAWATLPALRGAALWVALGVLVGVVALALLGRYARRDRRAVNAPSLLLLAAAVGAAFGAGLAAQAAQLVDGDCAPGEPGPPGDPCVVVGEHVEWLAVGVTTILAFVVAVVALRFARLARRDGWRPATHRLTTRATWLTALLGACGAVLTAVGVTVELLVPGGLPSAAGLPAWVTVPVVTLLVGPVLIGALVLAWVVPGSARRRAGQPADRHTRVLRGVGVAAVVVVAALVVLALRFGWTVTVLGIPLPPRTFPEFCLAAAILLPTAALLGRLYSGLVDRGVRRGVGVLWDVGTFWPRWFHPLAPPTYSDRAVPGLAEQIDVDHAAGKQLLLAPHSQGSVLAAAAVLAGGRRPHLAMLSYGSPWCHLYGEFFPMHVNADSTRAVADRLDGGDGPRWRNLARVSDPIGGTVAGVPHEVPLPDEHGRGHSDYWAEPEYGQAVAELRAMLDRTQPTATAASVHVPPSAGTARTPHLDLPRGEPDGAPVTDRRTRPGAAR